MVVLLVHTLELRLVVLEVLANMVEAGENTEAVRLCMKAACVDLTDLVDAMDILAHGTELEMYKVLSFWSLKWTTMARMLKEVI